MTNFWRVCIILISYSLIIVGCKSSSPASSGGSSSEMNQVKRNAETIFQASPIACPSLFDKIMDAYTNLQLAIQQKDSALMTTDIERMTSLTNACKAVAKNCGTPTAQKWTIKIGMSKAEVYCSSWGFPDEINTTKTAGYIQEQWVYRKDTDLERGYLYFDSGVLTAIQETR